MFFGIFTLWYRQTFAPFSGLFMHPTTMQFMESSYPAISKLPRIESSGSNLGLDWRGRFKKLPVKLPFKSSKKTRKVHIFTTGLELVFDLGSYFGFFVEKKPFFGFFYELFCPIFGVLKCFSLGFLNNCSRFLGSIEPVWTCWTGKKPRAKEKTRIPPL